MVIAVALLCVVMASCGRKEAVPPVPPFPWPPPAASATENIPLNVHRPTGKLSDADFVLSRALISNGYVEKSYYAAPGGFAVVTRLEQMNGDGTSKAPPARWSIAPPEPGFSLSSYVRALFTATPGFYRVIVFVVTDVPFSQTERRVDAKEALQGLRAGLNVLPATIGSQPYAQNEVCTALIYQFVRPPSGEPILSLPSNLDAQTHLSKSGLWASLLNPSVR